MTTTYKNTEKIALARWTVYVSIALGLICLVLGVIYHELFSVFYLPCYLLLYFGAMKGSLQLQTMTVNEEEGIIFFSDLFFSHPKSKHTMRIADIATIKCKRSWFGYYRIVIHDTGVRFSDIYATKSNAVRIRRHIKSLNPNIAI